MTLKNQRGFSLVELMIAVFMMAIIFAGMFKLFIYTSVEAEMAGNKTMAINDAQQKIEEIRQHDFDSIASDYSYSGTFGNSYNPSQIQGKGVVYIDSSNSELLVIETSISFLNKYGRVVGEDLDLDGTLDAGEDVNSNGKIDSPVKIMSMITRR